MSPARFIATKRDGEEMSAEQISELIDGYVAERVTDYQMAAWAMAVYLNGMTAAETLALTEAMLASGSRLSRPAAGPVRVDKHSTGGVGDKVSLVLTPLLACCGVTVPMLSGRGLGMTGGTLDKLEAIPGFRTDLTDQEIARVVAEVGCVITGATADIAPADRKLYAVRDVTATVSSVPLITASILSKKLAAELDALVLDVKVGSGAFMETVADGHRLAASLVEVATRHGLPTVAWLTDMGQPLGGAIGNAVEVDEAVEALEGGGPTDLREVTLTLSAELLVLAGECASLEEASRRLESELDSGRARERFARMVAAQGGDLDAPRRVAGVAAETTAREAGWVAAFDAGAFGQAVIDLGGGRRRAGEPIDAAVGLECLVRVGDRVEEGQPIVRVLSEDVEEAERVGELVAKAVAVSADEVPPAQTLIERVSAAGSERRGGEGA